MEKLYQQDPFLTRFTAQVVSCAADKGGWSVVLDRTAFYPEGGGQPWDTGTLNGIPVTQVQEQDGAVVHTCAARLEPGTQVEGAVNWARRFDLMQQHSGEHIVSGLIHSTYGYDNVGFHLGSDLVTIDFNGPLEEEDLRDIELRANQYIWEDRPVSVTYPTTKELAALDYRSKKAISGQVRIVSFPGADTCACCGTHVASAGQVGLVKLLSVQKFREGVRVELLCGGRALSYLDRVLGQNRRISNLLSAKPFETAGGVERLLGENQDLKTRLARMEEARFAQLADGLAGAGDVILFEEGLSPDGLRRLCDAVLQVCGGRCACFSGGDGEGYKYAIGLRRRSALLCEGTESGPGRPGRRQAGLCSGFGPGREDCHRGVPVRRKTEINKWCTPPGTEVGKNGILPFDHLDKEILWIILSISCSGSSCSIPSWAGWPKPF